MGVILCETLLHETCVATAAGSSGGAALTTASLIRLPLNGKSSTLSVRHGTAVAIDDVTGTAVWGTMVSTMAAPLSNTSALHSIFDNAIKAPTCIAVVGVTAIVLGRPNGVRIVTHAPNTHTIVALKGVVAVAADGIVAVLCDLGVVILDFTGNVKSVLSVACNKEGLSVYGYSVWANGACIQRI
jgi:hypothetical protein